MQEKIQALEAKICEMGKELELLRKEAPPVAVKNYKLHTMEGETHLLDLFAGKEVLFAIHNMGAGCRYCTLWADGINAFLPHLEDKFSVVLLSKDDPESQRRMANSRGWRFRMASHARGDYDQGVVKSGEKNHPGVVCYVRKGNEVFRKNATQFGPGDMFCALWHMISLAGFGDDNWTPQFNYWKAPAKLDDGGADVR